MRFKGAIEKYSKKKFWVGSSKNEGQLSKIKHYLIYPRGSGFDLFRAIGVGNGKMLICHVRKLKSAKKIASLMDNG